MAKEFDLLVGMHAHGCNMKIIDAAHQYDRQLLLVPCCVIDEPEVPPPGLHWLKWIANYAIEKGFDIRFFQMNFKGQNIGFHSVGTTQGFPFNNNERMEGSI